MLVVYYLTELGYVFSSVSEFHSVLLCPQPAILLTHSQAGQFGWILADARPSKVKAIIAIEPSGPPFTTAVFPPLTPARPYGLTEIPLTFSPPIQSADDLQTNIVSSCINFTCIQQSPPLRKLVNLDNVHVLVVTSEAG